MKNKMKKIIQNTLRKIGYELMRVQEVPNKPVKFDSGNYEIQYRNVDIDNKRYFIPSYALHRPVSRIVLGGSMAEPDTHKMVKILCEKRPGSIIHAGAFFGDMLPNFSKFVHGKVYAFEPVLENFVLAKLSVLVNDLSNVIIINSALSDSIANLKINTIDKNGFHTGGASHIDNKGIICPSLKIDNLEAQDIILIQLDVEGHELKALSGAFETINRCRPVIAIEDNENTCKNFLLDINYNFVRKIPGLKIYVPNEDFSIVEVLTSF